jgi:hypothetical protein
MTENKFELQSYFILFFLFVRILNLSKDITSKTCFKKNKITRKKHYWKNCQVSENSKNDIRTTPNKPYRSKRKLSTPKSRSTQVDKFELQSYFILYLLFVRILDFSKDIDSFLHISFFFVRERTCY